MGKRSAATPASPNRDSGGRTRPRAPRDSIRYLSQGLGADPVLLVIVRAAEAHAKDVMRRLPVPAVGGRPQMRNVNGAGVAIRHATDMRFDPTPMSRPELLQ